ncbi:MAG: hypothetical protein DF168_01257 [Candidatus Moanabacter tarae]|uniref:Membrane dipeptidase n=1 Tax=Candidatus Moanibacter tarae TaxID=2200854 RepID=A0A2Z4AG84_9BACT|nr:MAG: hypothetical protein DF168_01257 [Candidatus Moanabacter tarae]
MSINTQFIHNDALVIDSHNDTIVSHIRRGNLSLAGRETNDFHSGTVLSLRGPLDTQRSLIDIQIDFPKMRAGGIDAAFFAVDVTIARNNHLAYALDALGYFYNEIKRDEKVIIAQSAEDIRQAKSEGKLATILTVENSDVTERSLNILNMLHRLGVRSIGLTHDPISWAAAGNAETESGGGLTDYGKTLVKEMNQLGMLVDVSHISERGFWDLIETTEKPFIASHSNCRSLCNHPRNLTDDQITAIAEIGGSIGITFVPKFIDSAKPTFERLIDHIDHAVQLAGPSTVGIGSDFDGGGTLISDAIMFPRITEELLKRNYSAQDIINILGQNHLRVLEAALGN